MKAYKINGKFTYEFKKEIHADDYETAIEDFVECFIDQLADELSSTDINWLNSTEIKPTYFPDHARNVLARLIEVNTDKQLLLSETWDYNHNNKRGMEINNGNTN